MPVHDWTKVDAGLFHHFHHGWTEFLCIALNEGVLPEDYFAMVEQNIRGPIPDVLTLELGRKGVELEDHDDLGGLAVATAPPRTHLTQRLEAEIYAARANRITLRHRHGKVVAVVEIVSPGNKSSKTAFRAFVEKSADLIHQGINLLVIDLFPPGKRDPFGVHKAIWDEFRDEDLQLPSGKPLTLASYDSGEEHVAYVNFVSVGESLPDMPLFIRPEHYVPAPLEASYQTTWRYLPAPLKRLFEPKE